MLYGIGAVLPVMTAQKAGHNLLVSSVAGHVINPGGAVYSATKFGVRAIGEALRQEVKPHGLRTTILSPGAVDTELPQSEGRRRPRGHRRLLPAAGNPRLELRSRRCLRDEPARGGRY